MTTNQDLRKLAETAMEGDRIAIPSDQVIELLDRIDRLETENKILSNNLELAEEAGKELSHQYILRGERLEAARAENEAKDRLLDHVHSRALAIIEAPKDTWSDGKAVREMLREATHINAVITQHLKGTP